MRIAIVTWGSRGDFQPYLALAVGLLKAGHHVRLGAPPIRQFVAAASEHGVPFVPLGPELPPQELANAAARVWTFSDPIRQVRSLMDDLFLPHLEGMYEDCLALAQWSDLMVVHFFQVAGR